MTHIALGYGTNGDDDFSTADDLLIVATGADLAAGLHYVWVTHLTSAFLIKQISI